MLLPVTGCGRSGIVAVGGLAQSLERYRLQGVVLDTSAALDAPPPRRARFRLSAASCCSRVILNFSGFTSHVSRLITQSTIC